MKNSDALIKARNVIEMKLMVDGEYLSAKDAQLLKEASLTLYNMLGAVLHNEKAQEIQDFLKYMDDSFPDDGACDKDFEDFYNAPLTFSYKDKSIEFANSASVFQGMYDALKAILEEF